MATLLVCPLAARSGRREPLLHRAAHAARSFEHLNSTQVLKTTTSIYYIYVKPCHLHTRMFTMLRHTKMAHQSHFCVPFLTTFGEESLHHAAHGSHVGHTATRHSSVFLFFRLIGDGDIGGEKCPRRARRVLHAACGSNVVLRSMVSRVQPHLRNTVSLFRREHVSAHGSFYTTRSPYYG